MEEFQRNLKEALSFVQARMTNPPQVAVILGTGLGGVGESIEIEGTLPYSEIPYHPVTSVESHKGQLIWGSWRGKRIAALQGRFHLYEGYSAQDVSFPIRLLASLGVKILIVSNAAGGLNPHFQAGDLMLITDHINLTGHNPLVGPNLDEFGPRFPDMVEPYSRRLRSIAIKAALEEKMILHRGVYVGVLGPSLETASETRFLRLIGGDAVGMSTIIEVITAVHSGLEVLAISVITNVNLPDHYEPAPIEKVIATANSAAPRLTRLVGRFLEDLDRSGENP